MFPFEAFNDKNRCGQRIAIATCSYLAFGLAFLFEDLENNDVIIIKIRYAAHFQSEHEFIQNTKKLLINARFLSSLHNGLVGPTSFIALKRANIVREQVRECEFY